MGKNSFLQRTVVPVGLVGVTMAAALLVYNNAWRLDSHAAHQVLANVFAWVLFLSIGIGALVVYPVAYVRGAGLAERAVASLTVPLIWTGKEVLRVSASFTWAESLYFALNPLVIVVFTATVAEMGLCEILCRWARKRKGEAVTVAPLPALVVMCGGFAIGLTIFAWGFGVHAFYIFQEGYKALFGPVAGLP